MMFSFQTCIIIDQYINLAGFLGRAIMTYAHRNGPRCELGLHAWCLHTSSLLDTWRLAMCFRQHFADTHPTMEEIDMVHEFTNSFPWIWQDPIDPIHKDAHCWFFGLICCGLWSVFLTSLSWMPDQFDIKPCTGEMTGTECSKQRQGYGGFIVEVVYCGCTRLGVWKR